MIKLVGLVSPVIVPVIISGILFFSSERSNRPKLFLAGYMLMIAFIFLANAFYFEHNYRVYSLFHSLHIGTVLAIYPGAYTYVTLLTRPGAFSRGSFLHFLPAVLFTMVSAIIFLLLLDGDERILFLSEYRFDPDFSMAWLRRLYYTRIFNILVLFIQVPLYVFLIYRELRNHRHRMEEIFSNPDRFRLNWLGIFNISLALSAFVTVFIYTVNPARLFGDDRYLAYPMLVIALILWFLGMMGNNQPLLPLPGDQGGDGESGSDSERLPGRLAERIEEWFREEKPFLDPELKIWDVAAALGTNRTYISKTINLKYGRNFSAFVNGYRIEEAKRILEKEPMISAGLLAEEVGFGSVSSLSRAFREATGTSIQAYRSETR